MLFSGSDIRHGIVGLVFELVAVGGIEDLVIDGRIIIEGPSWLILGPCLLVGLLSALSIATLSWSLLPVRFDSIDLR